MHILEGKSHDILLDYITGLGRKFMAEADRKLDGVKTLDEWKVLRNEFLEIYKSAYPSEMFHKRAPLRVETVSEHVFEKYRIENVLFESFPGWYVNATVYKPIADGKYPGIVSPVGHSSKKFDNYTGSCQLLAMSGYIVVSFDPPGMQGEHIAGNDHFEDGARGYLSGFWSQSFFIMDAIRCIDYLETRDDVIQGAGFGMTGISGGGTTTIHSAVLDDRLACIAPVCCISDEEGVMFNDRYTFCPEGRGYGHIGGGIKYRTMVSLNAPIPCLIVAGRNDEVLRPELAAKNVKKAGRIYSLYDSGEIGLFVDDNAGHAYTPAMVNEVASFFDKYLKPDEEKTEYRYSYDDIEYPAHEKVLCHPKDTTSMYTMNLRRFDNASRQETPDGSEVAGILNIKQSSLPLDVYIVEEPKVRWVHRLEKKVYNIDGIRKIPALLLERDDRIPDDLLVYADGTSKWKALENDGYLARLANFIDRQYRPGEFSILSLELSGIGELSMDPGEYDIAGWSRTDRLLSYIAISLGTSILALRTEELLGVLNSCYESNLYKDITLAGTDEASIAVLLAAYIFGNCRKVIISGLPVSFRSIAEHVPNEFCPRSIIHNAPDKFEIYEIVNDMKNITLVNPIHADGTKLTLEEAGEIYNSSVNIIINEHGLDEGILGG
ncbi:MAG TPA: prolyl oligopeptidase family serine peptidase [Clostridia bacterium]|nr:prolyl oligopeptidase family serine peptidase [Clostridia bacterium]